MDRFREMVGGEKESESHSFSNKQPQANDSSFQRTGFSYVPGSKHLLT